jgi:hypothetical protein
VLCSHAQIVNRNLNMSVRNAAIVPQVFKIYVLAKITPHSLRQLLGVGTTPAHPSQGALASAASDAAQRSSAAAPMQATGAGPSSGTALTTKPGQQAAKGEELDISAPQDTAGATGYQGLPPDEVLSGSNVYSTAESCLLAWVTHQVASVFPNQVSAP